MFISPSRTAFLTSRLGEHIHCVGEGGSSSLSRETPIVLEAIKDRHSSVHPRPLPRSYSESGTTPDAFLLEDLKLGEGGD